MATSTTDVAPLRLVRGGTDIDLPAAEQAVADLLVALGQDPHGAHTRDTPRRVAAAYAELLTPRSFSLTTFPNDEGSKQVADWLEDHLRPKGVGVVVEAEHLCMSLRGVQASGSTTVTSALHGLLREDSRSRAEFFALAEVRP